MNPNSVTVTLTLKIATHFSHMTLWLIMMHQHTGFGYKKFSDSYPPRGSGDSSAVRAPDS